MKTFAPALLSWISANMKRILSSPHRRLSSLGDDSFSVGMTTITECEADAMFATLAQRLSSLKNYAPELDMVFATLFAGGAILGCRLMASLVSSNSAEFDGFVFLAAVYWIYSVVGYFTSRARSYRQLGTYLRRRCTFRSAIIATTVVAGLLGIAAAL